MKDSKLLNCPICNNNEFEFYSPTNDNYGFILCKKCVYRLGDLHHTFNELKHIHNNRKQDCPFCHEDIRLADIAKRMGHRPDVAFIKIKKLENVIIANGLIDKAPCCLCGYNGEDYYNPEKHKCMKIKQDLKNIKTEIQLYDLY